MEVKIEQIHIDMSNRLKRRSHGQPPGRCPVYFALWEAMGRPYKVYGKTAGARYSEIILPLPVRTWINDWDSGRQVKPITFEAWSG